LTGNAFAKSSYLGLERRAVALGFTVKGV
jgi:hypothetical protein